MVGETLTSFEPLSFVQNGLGLLKLALGEKAGVGFAELAGGVGDVANGLFFERLGLQLKGSHALNGIHDVAIHLLVSVGGGANL